MLEILPMSEWKEYRLGEIGEIITGKTPSVRNPEDWGNNFLFITPSDYCNYGKYAKDSIRKLSVSGLERLKKKVLPPKSILVTCIGSDMGKVVMNNVMCITNQQINAIVPYKEYDNDFVYYSLLNAYDTLRVLGGDGTAVPIVNKSDFENIVLKLPPLDEQNRIAGVLSSLDDKIDLLNRENATLEALAETLFRHYFIENPNPDWKEGKLGDEFNFTMGQSPSGDSFNEDGVGIPMYQGNADFGFRFPTKRVFTTAPTRFAEKNDTLISVRAPVGAQNMASEKCCIGRGVAAFRYKYNKEYYSYTYYKLKSLLEEIKSFNDNGTVFGSISKSDFENIVIVIPDIDTIKTFQEQIRLIDEKIHINQYQIITLRTKRDTLLTRLMSDEVKVGDN